MSWIRKKGIELLEQYKKEGLDYKHAFVKLQLTMTGLTGNKITEYINIVYNTDFKSRIDLFKNRDEFLTICNEYPNIPEGNTRHKK